MSVLCQLADPDRYRAFDWDLTSDPEDFAYWMGLFEGFPVHMERHLREDDLGGEDFDARWAVFLEEYRAGMAERRQHPERFGELSTIALGEYRQTMMDKHGWPDPYEKVKQRENDLAVGLYPEVIGRADATDEVSRWDLLLRGIFAGNLFDMGCPDTIEMYHRGEVDFFATFERLPLRPWFIDDADALCRRLAGPNRFRKVLFFVDNAGADIVLGVIPLVREMARTGIRVVLAANSGPALNDITFEELNRLLDRLAGQDAVLADSLKRGRLSTVASGSHSPLIDLSRISDACNTEAADADLIVLEGMGRGIESNWRQVFRCDVLRIALVKDRIVAKWLRSNLFDPVCRFEPGRDS